MSSHKRAPLSPITHVTRQPDLDCIACDWREAAQGFESILSDQICPLVVERGVHQVAADVPLSHFVRMAVVLYDLNWQGDAVRHLNWLRHVVDGQGFDRVTREHQFNACGE